MKVKLSRGLKQMLQKLSDGALGFVYVASNEEGQPELAVGPDGPPNDVILRLLGADETPEFVSGEIRREDGRLVFTVSGGDGGTLAEHLAGAFADKVPELGAAEVRAGESSGLVDDDEPLEEGWDDEEPEEEPEEGEAPVEDEAAEEHDLPAPPQINEYQNIQAKVIEPDPPQPVAPPPSLAIRLVQGFQSEPAMAAAYAEVLAAERGWFVVAPRSTITKPGHGDTIDELAKLYPEIDTSKVFVVGHSMGAGEAMREACANPKRFAAIAALGGGGGTKPAKGQEEAFQKLPIYVGVGEFDFALKQSEALAGNLQKAGVADIKFKKFPVLEHMIIVQDALPEVFQFFDGVMKR